MKPPNLKPLPEINPITTALLPAPGPVCPSCKGTGIVLNRAIGAIHDNWICCSDCNGTGHMLPVMDIDDEMNVIKADRNKLEADLALSRRAFKGTLLEIAKLHDLCNRYREALETIARQTSDKGAADEAARALKP